MGRGGRVRGCVADAVDEVRKGKSEERKGKKSEERKERKKERMSMIGMVAKGKRDYSG